MKVTLFSRIVGVVVLLAFSGCSTAPAINIVPVQNARALMRQMQQTTTQQTPRTQPQAQAQPQQAAAQPASPYWTGDGGRGKSITILPPRGSGLAENQAYLPDLVANELVSNFGSFSAMTLFDRVTNQRQYDELLSGYYADDDAAGLDLGHLAATDYMLIGDITRTSTGYVLQLTVNRNSDKTTLASYSGPVSIVELDNLIGVRRASLDLLQKMGIQLTELGRTELNRAPAIDHVQALTAMAQGINAQRQGTEVAALTYFFQAEAFNSSLAEAVGRTNVLSANISTGNIGANVANDFAWHDDWRTKLTETETLMNDMLRNNSPQRSIWYTTNIQEHEAARDHTRRTTELRIEAALHTHAVFPVSVQRTVQAVYDGLQTTGRAGAWRLNNWPRQGVTNTNPFNSRWGGMISIVFEVLNEQDRVIGRQTVEMDSRFSFNGTRLDGPSTAFTTVRFTGVDGLSITDRMNIRIASINGRQPEAAGISRIEPISAQQMQAQRAFTIYNGIIRPSSSRGELGDLIIPADLWGERVTTIANEAFQSRRLSSVTIPEGVAAIGNRAFAGNYWTTNVRQQDGTTETRRHGLSRITIPNSVTSIGQEAFASHYTTSNYSNYHRQYVTRNHWLVTEVTIGANVSLGDNAIGNGFEAFYARQNSRAGTYRAVNSYDRNWERFGTTEEMQDTVTSRARSESIQSSILGILVIAAVVGLLAWVLIDPSFRDNAGQP